MERSRNITNASWNGEGIVQRKRRGERKYEKMWRAPNDCLKGFSQIFQKLE